MKRTKLILSLLLMMTVNCLLPTAHAQWANAGSAGFSAGAAYYTSLDIDGSGTPYVAYTDGANSNKATVMKYNGSNWVTVGSAGFSAGAAYYTSLDIDGSGTPYIAFQDGANSQKATVMKYNGSSWVVVGSAGFSAGNVSTPSLKIDGSGTPYLVYSDAANSDKATVMKYNGSSWVTVGSAGFSAGSASFTTLAINASGTPYVAYLDFNSFSNYTTVMQFNGSSWVTVGSPYFSPGNAYTPSLALSASGAPSVAFQDIANNDAATVMKYNGSSWATVGSAGFSSGIADYVSLAIDGSGTPYVAFQDDTRSQKATVMKYDGSSWVNVGNAGFSAGAISYTSLSIDGSGTLYVAYRDGGNSNSATVMTYAAPLNTWDGTSWSGGAPTSADNIAINSNTAPTSFTCNNLTINSGFALNTGTSDAVTIYGNLINSGNGLVGTGSIGFRKTGTSTISGDTVAFNGTITVASGCTLQTSNKLRLTSNASGTGRIGASSGTITGSVMAQRYSTGKRAYRFYAHPFSSAIALNQLTDEIDITGFGGRANGFTPTQNNQSSAFWFDPTRADTSTVSFNSGWTPFSSANIAGWNQYQLMLLFLRGAKGEGLTAAAYTPSASTFEAAGTVNQGTQVVTLTKGANSTFAAVGNPFPSGVQMNTVTKGGNVGANYYAWDATSGAAGAYVTNAYTLSYILPAYAGFFTTISATTSITFQESDKAAGGAGLFKTTTPANWVELLISDSTTKWDRLLINLDDNAMDVEDKLDAKKLYNPGLDFYTLAKDDAHLAIDVRPYADSTSIPLGLTAYTRYNKYVIKTGMFDIPAGTKLILNDKYLNKTEELKVGSEYWFDVTSDTLSQGEQRFEINMIGKPTSIIVNANNMAKMQLIPNPAQNEVKLSFDKIQGMAQIRLISVTGQIVYHQTVNAGSGSVIIPLQNLPAGIYMAELQSSNARFTEKLIKE